MANIAVHSYDEATFLPTTTERPLNRKKEIRNEMKWVICKWMSPRDFIVPIYFYCTVRVVIQALTWEVFFPLGVPKAARGKFVREGDSYSSARNLPGSNGNPNARQLRYNGNGAALEKVFGTEYYCYQF